MVILGNHSETRPFYITKKFTALKMHDIHMSIKTPKCNIPDREQITSLSSAANSSTRSRAPPL